MLLNRFFSNPAAMLSVKTTAFIANAFLTTKVAAQEDYNTDGKGWTQGDTIAASVLGGVGLLMCCAALCFKWAAKRYCTLGYVFCPPRNATNDVAMTTPAGGAAPADNANTMSASLIPSGPGSSIV